MTARHFLPTSAAAISLAREPLPKGDEQLVCAALLRTRVTPVTVSLRRVTEFPFVFSDITVFLCYPRGAHMKERSQPSALSHMTREAVTGKHGNIHPSKPNFA
jgi:hypothetical protein